MEIFAVGAVLALRQQPVGIARLGRLALGQQQARLGAVELRPQGRFLGWLDGADQLARARDLAAVDQRVHQRALHQRRVALGTLRQRLLVALHRARQVAPARAHVADDLVRRAGHDLGVPRRVAQRLARELGRLVELARVAVDDRQVPVGQRLQVLVALGVGQVQRLAGGPHALAELTRLGQRHRLTAVLVAVELDRVLRIQDGAVAGQRQQGVGVGQARALGLLRRGLGVQHGLRAGCRQRAHQGHRQGDRPQPPFRCTPNHCLHAPHPR
ncbi:hypothetical protein [Ottowia sp.]|uniref:hypothetical protein n=1 Tax=Ottowia sp. TaxID=1898956 RepID=UPI002B76DB4F|nr:hypothetical protein [Ottowia sp.]HRN75770.1 hypothetical protein [Ottowia sp.]HRQ03344.1 hypothetical protein [Ottowia sp.]